MATSQEKPHKSARDLLLDVAEDIFLTDGYDGVSVRELTDAAGVNVAAVNYHFGGKRNLFLEVLHRRFTTTAERKRSRLQAVIDAQPIPDLRQLITAHVGLFIGDEQTLQGTQQLLRLVARELADDNDAMELLTQELILPIHQVMKTAVSNAKPHLAAEKVSLCVSSIIGQVFHFARCPEIMRTLAGRANSDGWLNDVRDHIIEFSLKGLEEE